MAAGVVADLFPKNVRGPAMGTFVLTVFTANATGPLCAAWIAFKLNWHVSACAAQMLSRPSDC